MPASVRFTQSGEMQLKPGRWSRFEASQEARVDRVQFSWRARFALAPLLSIRVQDWYRDGDGALEARLLGIRVAQSAGAETARSEAMRYLAELPWFTHAVLVNRELEWRELGANELEVSTGGASTRATIRLSFDEKGEIVRVFAPDRPRQEGKRIVERPWEGSFADYRPLGGVRVPTAAEVVWQLPDGPFPYFRARVTGLEVVDRCPAHRSA